MTFSARIALKEEFKDCVALRIQVFCEEQGIDPNIEVDEQDQICTHFLLFDGVKAIGTCRLVPPKPKENQRECSLGRLVVLKEYRKKGLGLLLCKTLAQEAVKKYSRIIIHAQLQAIGFYEKAGYKRMELPVFMEAGIPHVVMALKL